MPRLKFLIVLLLFCLTTLYSFRGVRVRDNNQHLANNYERDDYLYLTGDNLYFKSKGRDEILLIEYVTDNQTLKFHGDLYVGQESLSVTLPHTPFLNYSGDLSSAGSNIPQNATHLTLDFSDNSYDYNFFIHNQNVNLLNDAIYIATIPFFEAFRRKKDDNSVSYVPIMLDANLIEFSGFRFEKSEKKIAVDFGSSKTVDSVNNSLMMKNVTVNADFLHVSAELRSELKLVSYNETVVNLTNQFPAFYTAKLIDYDHALIQVHFEGGAANHMLEVSSNLGRKASAVVNASGGASLFFVEKSSSETSYNLGLFNSDNKSYISFPSSALVKVLCQYYNLE